MDSYLLSNVPRSIVKLQRTKAQSVKAKLEEAIQRIQIAAASSYDNIIVLSLYWKSDDTGGAADSDLFIQTLSQLQNVQTYQKSLSDEVSLLELIADISPIVSRLSESRRLFILHYAGHAISNTAPDNLIVTPRIGQKLDSGPYINMFHIKTMLKDMASKSKWLDILLVMDFCRVAISGRGMNTKGARVEFMAATVRKDACNRKMHGRTFTQHWCKAFTERLKTGAPFTCEDLREDINLDSGQDQFLSFVLREGWNAPITFCLCPGQTELILPATVTSESRTVIMAIHVEENPDSPHLNQLIDYLNKAPVPITILAVLPTSSSTLLLLRIPLFLHELLTMSRVTFMLTHS